MKNVYRHSLTTVCVLSLSALPCLATKYAGEFLSMGVGARALGMGGAFVALANDASAAYWNPAGLVQAEGRHVSIMHAERFAGIVKYDWLSYIQPCGSGAGAGTFGFSCIRLGVDDIPITALPDEGRPLDAYDNRPYVARWASDAEYAFYASYARRAGPSLAYGGNIKVLRKSVDTCSAWGLGLDISALYRLSERLNLGLNLQDATTTLVAWDNGTRESISPTLKIGGAYRWDCHFLQGMITPAFDVDIRFENRDYASRFHWGRVSADVRFGAEYWLKRLLALRLGSDDLGRFSAGTGFCLRHVGFNLEEIALDFAFLSKGDLDNTYRVSASLGF